MPIFQRERGSQPTAADRQGLVEGKKNQARATRNQGAARRRLEGLRSTANAKTNADPQRPGTTAELTRAQPQTAAGKPSKPRGNRNQFSVAIALITLVGLLFSTSPSLAARPRALKETLGASGSGAGQLQLRAAGEGVVGSGVAVNDSTHDVYVADTGNHRIDEFDPLLPAAEQFVRAWGWGVDKAKPEARLQECTTATGCLPGTSGSAPGEFEAPAFITVDSAPGGEGDVYIGDTRDNVVSKFTPEGELLKLWGMDGQLNGSTTLAGSFGPLAGIAVSASGMLDLTAPRKSCFSSNRMGRSSRPK